MVWKQDIAMSALEELQELYKADPDTERISLRARQLERVDAETEYIHLHFPHTRHLDLSENALDALPADFGQLLPKLVALDLTKNRLRSVADLGEVLQQCASLKSLSVSLKSATEEKLLLVMLPKLRILNGTPLPGPSSPPPPPPDFAAESLVKPVHALATALLSPSTASNSSTGGDGDSGRLASPPPPPPPLPPNVRTEAASPALRISSPQDKRTLRLQFANLRSERQAVERTRQRDFAGATDALLLNRQQRRSATVSVSQAKKKTSSVRPTETPASISDDRTDWRKLLKAPASVANDRAATTEAFLTELKTVVKAFHASGGGSGGAQQLQVYDQLDRHVATLAAQLSRQESDALLPNGDDDAGADVEISRLTNSVAVLQTRWRLLEVCGVYGVERASGVDGELGGAFERLLAMQRQVLKALQLQQAAIAAKAQRLAAVGVLPAPSQPQQPQLEQQMKTLLEVAESLESDLEAAQTRLKQEKAQRELLEQENWSLKRENDAYKRKSPAALPTFSQTPASAGFAAAAARASAERPLGAPRQRVRQRTDAHGHPQLTSLEPVSSHSQPATTVTPAVPPARIRNLTLKQLVDLIQCITTSKLRADTRALEVAGAGAPRETMEQHMYAYLNQRFGLHALIVDYASAIWKGCEAFASQANDVAVFLALLRCELDEGFLTVKHKLQQALVDLLRAYFQAAYPLKQERAIVALVQNRVQHDIFADEWRELLTYLYDAQDVRVVVPRECGRGGVSVGAVRCVAVRAIVLTRCV